MHPTYAGAVTTAVLYVERAEPPRKRIRAGQTLIFPTGGLGTLRLLTNLRHGTGGGCMPDGVSGGREGAS